MSDEQIKGLVTDKTVAVKFDTGKPRYGLFPAYAMEALANVYTFGEAKYDSRNWEQGLAYSRVYDAIFRHVWAFIRGEDIDRESGLHHMAHAAFGCLALVEYFYTKKGVDDRPYNTKEQRLVCVICGTQAPGVYFRGEAGTVATCAVCESKRCIKDSKPVQKNVDLKEATNG